MRLAATALALTLLLALAGCGGGGGSTTASQASAPSTSPTSTSTTTSNSPSLLAPSTPSTTSTDPNAGSASAPATPAEIHLSSSALPGNPEEAHPIPARYTCAGADVSLPLSWGLVPSGTREVGVFVMHHANKGRLAADWALLGLKPSVRAIPTGTVPAGAVVGRNSAGQTHYSVCPPAGKELEYGVFVFAFRRHARFAPGFNAVPVFEKALAGAAGQGLIGFTFKR